MGTFIPSQGTRRSILDRITGMRRISFKTIKQKRWLLDRNAKIFGVEEAREFIERLGFVSTITNEQLPSLAKAIYTEDLRARFEADQRLWDFVHILVSKKWVYYGYIPGGHYTLVSMKLLPDLLCLRPTPDYRSLYNEGHLSETAKVMMDLLKEHGPLMTRELRDRVIALGQPDRRKLNGALIELQRKSLICCSGRVAQHKCRWRFGLWSTTDAWVPSKVKKKATMLSEEEAKRRLIEKYIYATACTTSKSIARFFNWSLANVENIVSSMIDKELVSSYNQKGEQYLFKGNL